VFSRRRNSAYWGASIMHDQHETAATPGPSSRKQSHPVGRRINWWWTALAIPASVVVIVAIMLVVFR